MYELQKIEKKERLIISQEINVSIHPRHRNRDYRYRKVRF